MMIRNTIRYFSTRIMVDKFYKILQASSPDEKQIKLNKFIKYYCQDGQKVYSNLFNDIIQRWPHEQPTKEALWSSETDNKLTFNDIYDQSSRIANVLTGKEFNLKPGQAVLVVLPNMSVERILIQLACLQSGLVFCSIELKDLSMKIPNGIQKLAADCVITNNENLKITKTYTCNPLRPLKKGLITNCSTYEPLPVGWNQFMESVNNAENKYTKKLNIHPQTPVIRSLSNDNQVVQYSQKDFYLHLIISAVWLNINRTSRLIWMTKTNEIMSIASWFSGSSIFYKNIEHFSTILKTFENYPIDTFYASSMEYQMLDNQKYENKTHLKQLISTEPIDSTSANRWFSFTKLNIRNDYTDFYNKSMLTSVSKENHAPDLYWKGPIIAQRSFPSEELIYQFPINRERPRV